MRRVHPSLLTEPMMGKDKLPAGAPWFQKQIKISLAELEIWRSRHPDSAGFVTEEARAIIEGREPKFGPPIIRG